MLRVAADLPDPAVRLAPVLEGRLDLADEDRPDPLVEAVARLRVEVDRVEHRAPHVVLALPVGGVADADRPRPLVAGEVVEGLLLRHRLAVDAVHDLEVASSLGDVGDEMEVVVRLPVEAERVEAPQRERRVADPAVAVVPVALAARRLGQRGRRRRDDGAARRVGQALQRERRALEVRAPRVVGERAARQPVLPVVGRPDEALVRVLEGARRRVPSPRRARRTACSPSLSSVRPSARGPSKPMFMSLVSTSSTSVPSDGRRPGGTRPRCSATTGRSGRSRRPARSRA